MNTDKVTQLIADNIKEMHRLLTRKEFEELVIEALDLFAVTKDERKELLEEMSGK